MEGEPSDENLVFISDTSDSNVLYTIQDRFNRKRIYTRVGDHLVVVNPYETYPIYDEKVMSQYQGENKNCHVFAVARDALTAIREGSDAENIIFCGESGAGKSYHVHHTMMYLASQNGSKVSPKHIQALTTIFNSFASAKTVKNDNATRFGCAIDFLYKSNILSGLSLKTTTPLELIRVVSQKPGERNFNIFYEVVSGLSQEKKSTLGIKDGQKFFYANQGKGNENQHQDDKNFGTLDEALEIMGFSEEQRMVVYKTIAAILHIGNIYFRQKRSLPSNPCDAVELGNESEVKWSAYLLELDSSVWSPSFVKKITKTEEGFTTAPYDMGHALDARDSLAQLIYEELFNWILKRISHHLRCRDHNATISVVDIYGYEKYNNNGLEQLFINTVNERVENVFVKQCFYEPMENYIREGVHAPVEIPSHLDNSKVVDLLTKKPYGLLNLLDDEAKFPKGSDESYLQHCTLNHVDKGIYGKPRSKDRLEFSLRHFAGTSWYTVLDFVHRNKRAVPAMVLKTLAESQNSVISMLFRPIVNGKENADLVIYNAKQISSATNNLAEKILNGGSHYILCVRSNNERQTAKFDLPLVSRQLKWLAVNELLTFRLKGYPIRIPFAIFTQRYRCLLASDIAMCQKQKEIIVDILEGQGTRYAMDYKIGRNYVFLRDRLSVKLDGEREEIRKKSEIIIQKTIRAYVARKKFLRQRKAAIVLQAGLRGWKARKVTATMREEMQKKLGIPSRRNRRLEAYHLGLKDPTENDDMLIPSTITDYLDMPNEASKAIERGGLRPEETQETKTTMQYLGSPLTKKITLDTVSLEEFSEQNYKGHLLEVRREPIITPFLQKENDLDFRMSLEIFKLILKYMNDTKLKQNQLDDLARYIVQQGINNPYQRDEIYVQICNQTYKNKDKVATERGFRLLQMSVSCFPPTENVLPMLFGFINNATPAIRNRLEDTIQRRLKVKGSQTARQLPPSQLELAALQQHHNSAVSVNLSKTEEELVEAHSWITNAEIANRVLRYRGIGDPSGWTVEFEKDGQIISATGNHFFHDALVELELGKPENRNEIFLNFSNEKTLPPMNKKKLPPVEYAKSPVERRKNRNVVEKTMSPLVDRRLRRASGNRSRDGDLNESRERIVLPPTMVPSEPPSDYNDNEKKADDEEVYSYTVVNKKKPSSRSTTPNGLASPVIERYKPYEVIEERTPMIQKSPTPVKAPPGFQDVRPNPPPLPEMPPPSFIPYTAQQTMVQPIIQYVPVMMQPQMMAPMMSGQTMMTPYSFPGMQMQPTYSMQPQQQWAPPQNPNTSAGYATVDDDRYNEVQDRRVPSRAEHIPAEYSSNSVASRIRRMPVPDNNRDVDRFLDEVFEQVLSPEECRGSPMNPQQIANSIKGGARDPAEYDMPPYSTNPDYSRISNNTSNHGYYQVDSDRYDYIDRERANRSYDSPRMRARSLPRIQHADPNISQRSNGYSQIRESSVDRSPRKMDGYRSLPRHDVQPPFSPVPPAPVETSQPMVVMMPVEIHENGQVIPLMSPSGQSLQSGSRKSYMLPTTFDPNLIQRAMTPEQFESSTMQRRAITPLTQRYDGPNMRAVLQQQRQTLPPEPAPRLNGASRVTSPIRSPATERKMAGLNRVPLEHYMDPVVQNTVSNSERPNPSKITVPESRMVREIAQKEKEALRKLNERLQKLPPPVENIRVFLPRKVVVPPPEKKPEMIIPDEPDWTHPVYFPPPPPVQHFPTHVPEMPKNEWIFEGEVERPPELQERVKGAASPAPVILPPTNGIQKPKEEKPAVKYVKQPWKLTIRKEMFYPQEQLDDLKVIDQVFSQIIDDCRRAIAYRIRAYERDDVSTILKQNAIPPDMLNRQHEIPTAIKAEVVEAARKWPLYFSQIYEVVEERVDESVSVLLSIAEHGIRLLLHTPSDKENPLKVQDHLTYSDIVEATLEADDIICIHTRSGMSIRLRSPMAGQISEQIEKCLYGAVKRRQFVKAVADYYTTQPNLLSFQRGDIIELVGAPEGQETPETWLYGKIENRFGNLPSQYVVPLDDNMDEVAPPPLPLMNDDLSSSDRTERMDHPSQPSYHGYLDELDEIHNREMPDRYHMMEYAMKYFRVPKGYDTTMKRGKKQWTWQNVAYMIKWTDKPISHSLLQLESNDLDKLATESFLCIMRYMGDESMKRGESITDVVYRLLLICHKNNQMRDEIYCQIMRQTTNNNSQKNDSWSRGWRLFTILASYFDCSLSLKPYLLTYLADNADDMRRPFHGTAQVCLQNLRQTFQYGGRKYLLGAKEVEELTNGKIYKRQQYNLPGSHKKMINTKSITVVEEIIQEMCNEMNIRSPTEQQEFSLCYVTDKDNRIEYCSNGDYILDICTEMDHKKIPFHFVLRRSVWVHPLRLDNPIFIDVMFFQLVPDYLLGYFVSMQASDSLSASATDDVIQLAALLHLAANNGRQTTINSKALQALIPATVLSHRIMHNDNWVDRINRKLNSFDMHMSPIQARAAFLDVLSRWPLFGASNYSLDSISCEDRNLPNLELSVGKKGVSFLAPLSHRIFEEWQYDKVASCTVQKEGRGDIVELVVKTQHGEKTYEMRTSEAANISRTLQQYKFVVQENEGLL